MSMRKARVVKVNPRGTVDLVFLDDGWRVTNVEVLNESSTSGCSWHTPNVPLPSTEANAGLIENGVPCMVAICGFIGSRPIVVGFSRPHNALSPAEQNRWLDVHDASGTYETVAPDGSYEMFVPGGGYLRIGTGAHEDLSSKLSAGELPAAGPPAITVTLATAHGTLTLAPSGAWTLTGASLAIDCDTTITGSLTVTHDAIISGKSFLGHKHGEVQGGSDETSVPI